MLGNYIETAKYIIPNGTGIHVLQLHAENCGGQNTNRFIVWFLIWRVTIQVETDIIIYFLIGGHTKNWCDGAFGCVKLELKTKNVLSPE